MSTLIKYAGPNVGLDRVDVRKRKCLSVDLRAQTGDPSMPEDASCLVDAGVFSLSVFAVQPGEYPVGEIRIWYPPAGREVRLVGHLTGRLGVTELTPDHVVKAENDAEYRKVLEEWLRS